MDSSRIGGGVTEYIEQVAASAYNWMVQMMYVHYDNEHYFNAIGLEEGQQMIALKNTRFTHTLTITVKEGSMIPKDPLTQRNEAIDLWSANAIDPLSLYKKLEFPDPVGATKKLIMWQMLQKGQVPPDAYLPGFSQGQQEAQLPQPGQGTNEVNPLPDGANAQPTPQPGAQVPEQVASRELLDSVPIR
jgi:hypothetical protein